MPLDARVVSQSLKTKGFKEDKKRDHYYYFFFHNGKKTNIYTKISHGESEIHDKNCGSMARQVRLTMSQFKEFVDCPMKQEQYVAVLTSQRLLEIPPVTRSQEKKPSSKPKKRRF